MEDKGFYPMGISAHFGFSHAYRSCKWKAMFLAFLHKRLAFVSLKMRRLTDHSD